MKMFKLTKLGYVAVAIITALATTSCRDQDFNIEDNYTKPVSELPDFNLSKTITIDADYGKIGAGALLEIFACEPTIIDENGIFHPKEEPIYKVFIDENGQFVGDVEVPSYVENVWVIANGFSIPYLTEAAVISNTASIKTNAASTRATRATNAATVSDNPTCWTISEANKLYGIVTWSDKYGTIAEYNDNGIIGTYSNISDLKVNDILKNELWHGYATKYAANSAHQLDNSSLVKPTSTVNTTIVGAYTKDGETYEVEWAQLWVTFLHERAGYLTPFGYYFYPKDQVPSSPDNVKKFLIIPNASIISDGQDGGITKDAISVGTDIQLLFQDEEGNFTPNFPPGYTVGFFAVGDNGWDANDANQWRSPSASDIKLNNRWLYSNVEWNSDGKSKFVAFNTTSEDGAVVYGFEDGGDSSYEDVLFAVRADVKEKVYDSSKPTVDPDTGERTSTEIKHYTYLFEDMWPNGGDYDMNDIMIEHTQTIGFNNANYVKYIEDSYVAVQPDGSATYADAFGVQYDQISTNSNISDALKLVVPKDSRVEDNGNNVKNVILFTSGKDLTTKTFTVRRNFYTIYEQREQGGSKYYYKDGELIKTNVRMGYSVRNPFIVVESDDALDNDRLEVHMPLMAPTIKDFSVVNNANATYKATKYYKYYIDSSLKYPYAVCIPSNGSDSQVHFTPVTEGVNITVEYKKFSAWVEAGCGTTYADWYDTTKSGYYAKSSATTTGK